MNFLSKDIGIDLGTANTLVYMKGKGIIMREPSVVAVDTRNDEVRCVGAEAKAVIGRTPGSIVAVRPLKDGVIADFDITANMLENFLKKACGNSLFARPRVVICIPSGVTEVERRAVREATLKAGARQVSVIEEPMAAAIGAIHAGATLGEAAAATTATGAQVGLNAALLACPITWVILAVIALIAIFYAAVAAVNHFAGTSYSATGLIAGGFLTMAALVGNAGIGLFNGLIQFFWSLFAYPVLGGIEWLLNAANGGFDSFGGAVANLIGNIIGWFLSLGQVVTTIIDAIFGTNWTAGLEALKSDVTAWGKNENDITIDRTAPTIDYRFSYGDAFRTGNEFGQGIEDSIKGLFDFSGMDPMGAGGDPFALGDTLEDIYGSTADTAANTAAAADALDFTQEDLTYLRDIAEREAINRFTTAEIKIEQHNENHLSSDTDLDGIMDAWASDFARKLDISTEGVHT